MTFRVVSSDLFRSLLDSSNLFCDDVGMKKHTPEHWRILGRYIQRQRLHIEPDMREWAAKIGRSTRVLQGLERGEPQGMNTVTLVAVALDVHPEVLFGILETGKTPGGQATVPTEHDTAELLTQVLAEMRALRADRDDLAAVLREINISPEDRERLQRHVTPPPPLGEPDTGRRKSTG